MSTCVVPIPSAPSTSNIGVIEEPLLVCGGAYGNREALAAFLDRASRLGVRPERIVHTGDAVAYGADPAATVDLLRHSGVHAIQGNVEQSLAGGRPDCGCGFDRGSSCDALSARWFAYVDSRIDGAMRAWMGGLPQQLTFTMAGRRVRVVHGGVRRINAFIYASTPDPVFEAELDAARSDVVVAGHGCIPFTRRFRSRAWHNSGSLGLPANDGTPRVWFSRLEPDREGIRFTHLPLTYDFATARRRMVLAGLPLGYADALATGRWPSLGALPPAERRMTGQRLEPAARAGGYCLESAAPEAVSPSATALRIA